MNRRSFLQQCGFVTAGIALSGGMGLLPGRLLASHRRIRGFSLNLITDRPDEMVVRIEALIDRLNLPLGNLKFKEVSLSGTQVGDIVLVRNDLLIDYRSSQDDFSEGLLALAREFGLPRKMNAPALLRFYAQPRAQAAKQISVYRKNVLVRQYNIDSEVDADEIEGQNGSVVLTIKDKQTSIRAASCKHKTCMKMGRIRKPGQNLVCIPNQIRIAIQGENEFGIDSLSF